MDSSCTLHYACRQKQLLLKHNCVGRFRITETYLYVTAPIAPETDACCCNSGYNSKQLMGMVGLSSDNIDDDDDGDSVSSLLTPVPRDYSSFPHRVKLNKSVGSGYVLSMV